MTPEEFRSIRAGLELTQSELAAVAGVSQSAVSRAEAAGLGRGAMPTLMRLLARHPELVAEAVECSGGGEANPPGVPEG